MSETRTPWKRRPLCIIQRVISFREIIGNFIFTSMCLDSAGAYFPKALLRCSRIHIGADPSVVSHPFLSRHLVVLVLVTACLPVVSPGYSPSKC